MQVVETVRKGARRQRDWNLPPKFSQCFAEFRVVEMRVLIGQLPPCSLSPHHKRVHGSFDMRLAFTGAVHAHRHGHQGPVVTLQNLGHRVSDAHGKLFFLALLLVVWTPEEMVVGRPGVLGVRAGPWGTRRARGVLRHAGAGSVGVTLLLFFCHFQVRVEEIHAKQLQKSFSQQKKKKKEEKVLLSKSKCCAQWLQWQPVRALSLPGKLESFTSKKKTDKKINAPSTSGKWANKKCNLQKFDFFFSYATLKVWL